MSEDKSNFYLWFDTEFTSLDLDNAVLLQVALVVTDTGLKRITPAGDDLVLHVAIDRTTQVSPWSEEHLKDVLKVCRSEWALPVEEVDARLAAHVAKQVGPVPPDERLRPVLAGNSIHGDWFLARKFLPRFSECMHYRHLDVSSVKLEWLGWFQGQEFDKADPALLRKYFPESGLAFDTQPHDAYYDVVASIAELGFYRSKLRGVKEGSR